MLTRGIPTLPSRASRGYKSARIGLGGLCKPGSSLSSPWPPKQGQFVQLMKDRNQGIRRGTCSKRAPPHPHPRACSTSACVALPDRAGQAPSAGQGQSGGHRPGSSVRRSQKQKLAGQALLGQASLVCPNPTYSHFTRPPQSS